MALVKDGTYLGESSYPLAGFVQELAARSGIPASQINVSTLPNWIGVEGVVMNGGENAQNVLGAICDVISSIALFSDYNDIKVSHLPSLDDYTGLWTLDETKYIVTPIQYNTAATQPQQFKLSYIEKYSNDLNETYEYLDNSSYISQPSEVSISSGLVLTPAQAKKAIKTAKLMYGFETGNISWSISYKDQVLRLGQIILFRGKLYRINSKVHDHHLITYTAMSDSQLFYRDKSTVLPDPTPIPPIPVYRDGLAWCFISSAPLLSRAPMLTPADTDFYTALTYSRDSETSEHTYNSITANTNQNAISCLVTDYFVPSPSQSNNPMYLPYGRITLTEQPIASGKDTELDYYTHGSFNYGYLYSATGLTIGNDIEFDATARTVTINRPCLNFGSKESPINATDPYYLTSGRAITTWQADVTGDLVTKITDGINTTSVTLNKTTDVNKAGRGITPVKILPFIFTDSAGLTYVYFQYSKQTGDVRRMSQYPEDADIAITVNNIAVDVRPDRRIYCKHGDTITINVTGDTQASTTDTKIF